MGHASQPTSGRGPGRPTGTRPGEARAELLRAARDLMAEKGLPRVTAREVAERADRNPGLVRYYFGSREGLLRAVVDEFAGEAEERRAGSRDTAGPPRERLRRYLASAIEEFRANPYAPRLITEQVLFADDDFAERFVAEFVRGHVEELEDILEAGRRSGDFRELDAELVIPAITGAMLFYFLAASVFQRVFGGEPLGARRVDRFSEAVADLVLDGLRAREAGR